MEQRLKERLVGATLLVVAGIVFIPWLLDGRSTTRPVTQPLTLPQNGDAATRTKTIPLVDQRRQSQLPAQPQVELPTDVDTAPVEAPVARVAPEPVAVPVPRSPAASPSAATAQPRPTQTAAAQPPAPKAEPKPEPAPLSGDPVVGFAVQVGAFSSQSNAARLAERLSGKGYKAFVSRKVVDGRVLYRVRVGPEPTRAAAEALGARLKEDKQPVRIVEHPG